MAGSRLSDDAELAEDLAIRYADACCGTRSRPFAGVLSGEVWSITMESIRLGNDHLSYRTSRIPWKHHGLALFAGGVALYWLVAAWRRYHPPVLNTRPKI